VKILPALAFAVKLRKLVDKPSTQRVNLRPILEFLNAPGCSVEANDSEIFLEGI
jgi:hypothetical protein